jgi:subtilisin family serine protease
MLRKILALIITLSAAFAAIALWPIVSASHAAPIANDPLVWVSVIAGSDARLAPYFVGQTYQRSIGDLRRISGHVYSSTLTALKQQPNVVHLSNGSDLPTPPQFEISVAPTQSANFRSLGDFGSFAQPSAPLAPKNWFENDTQGVRETWNTFGVTGTGVAIAILDTGVDFGNPALNGRYAIESTTITSALPYNGWPIAFDDRSLSAYLSNPSLAWPANWGWYVNSSRVVTVSSAFTFTDPISATRIYTVLNTSLSGEYHLGYHPDPLLRTGIYSAPVLVADEIITGQYNAVYLDLDKNGSFETRVDKNQPVATIDLTADGVADRSAGMIYWIADGVNPLPGAESIYGTGTAIPANGSLVAFMIDTTSDTDGGHGTMCASTAIGNDGGVFTITFRIPVFYSLAFGPIVQGPAPGAKLIAMGNVYASGSSIEAHYLFTLLGYDGVPNSGDEPRIVSLSYGSSVDNDSWDWESRFIDYLNYYFDQQYGVGTSPLFIHSAGNGGYDAGTLIQPNAATALNVAASTQYGTAFNASVLPETVSLASRVSYGDIASLSSRGPGANGTRPIDLAANGSVGSVAYPINNSTSIAPDDGTQAHVTFQGTSRSAPDTAGMAALIAQAFKQTHGRFPTRVELADLLINGAIDIQHDPLAQGAGRTNAFRSVQLSLENYGFTIDPPHIIAGTFRGQRYLSFATGLQRGDSETETITVTNVSAVPITVTLSTQQLIQLAHYSATIQTITDTASNYISRTPDYAINLTPWITANPDADLMVVRLTYPFEHFDTLPPSPSSISNTWRLVVYNWWDDNPNGAWWTDTLTPNGRIDLPGEIDSSDQWLRFDYGLLQGTQQEVRVARPYARSVGSGSAGVWAGAAHTTRHAINNRTVISFDVTFYRQATWPEITLSTQALQLAANSQTTLTALIQVPVTSAYGLHAGSIVISDAGRLDISSTFKAHTSLIPVTWQVEPDVTAGATITDRVYGGFAWSSDPRFKTSETGDWRFYNFDLNNPPAGSVVLAHSIWEDYPTDIDTIFFGPALDTFSDDNPDWFGPYALNILGGSVRTGSNFGRQFQTASGTTEEWAGLTAQDGLNSFVQQTVLFGGHQESVPFTTALGLAYVQPYPLSIEPACSYCIVTATFKSSIDIANGLTGTHAFGWVTPTITQANILAGQTVTQALSFTQLMYRVDVSMTNVISASDLDLYLYNNSGSNAGALDTGDQLIAESFGGGVTKSLIAHNLITGTYWLLVAGQTVDPAGGSFKLRTIAIPNSSDGMLLFVQPPPSIVAGQNYTLSLQVNSIITNGMRGLIVFGPTLLRSALEVPITIEPQSSTPTAIVVASLKATSSGTDLTPIGLLGLSIVLGLIGLAAKRRPARRH